MFKLLRVPLTALLLSIFTAQAHSLEPVLNFSDLISGPDTGLRDGQGSGVIVTIWGQHLGSNQATSTLTFTDVTNKEFSSPKIYYWKDANGQLPGGPANLYESHSMQEIAFSIPDVASGAGTIHVTVNGQDSNKLPFTVRSGNIYHVKSSGSDSSGDGSFGKPWRTAQNALDNIDDAGATLYVHDSVVDGSDTTDRAIYWNNASAAGTIDNQFAVVAYPGSQPAAKGYSGFLNYNTSAQVVSKYTIFASECDEGKNGQPTNCATGSSLNKTYGIQASAYGRGVGNRITDRVGGCADGTQAAISGNALNGNDRVSGYQILGNEVHDYGCAGSNKLHHTTYLSIRSADLNLKVPPWRFGWNYLHDNHTKNGIHQYDENQAGTLCGSPNNTVIINDNVIVNQSGAGINIGANCPWTNDFEVYNNVLINVGLAVDWDGIDPSTANGPNTSGISVQDGGLSGTVRIFNNTIHTWNDDDIFSDTQACLGLQGTGENVSVIWSNNICITDKDKPFVAPGCCGAEVQLDHVTGVNNAWYYNGTGASRAIVPDWDVSAIIVDPLITKTMVKLSVGPGSQLIGASTSATSHDLYGVARLPDGEIGAVEYLLAPGNPSSVTIE